MEAKPKLVDQYLRNHALSAGAHLLWYRHDRRVVGIDPPGDGDRASAFDQTRWHQVGVEWIRVDDLPQVACLVKEALVQTATTSHGSGGDGDGDGDDGNDGVEGEGCRDLRTCVKPCPSNGQASRTRGGTGLTGKSVESGEEGTVSGGGWLGRPLLHAAEFCVGGVGGGGE